MFAFALLGLFTSSLSAITFRPNFPLIADCFENISVIFVAVAFASLVSIFLHERYGWMPYMACMIPVLPFSIVPCKSLFAKLEAMLMWLRGPDCSEGLPIGKSRQDTMEAHAEAGDLVVTEFLMD
ncbi:hypothetical protein DsansV1_C15g0132891 [Dioscorea sansibarensis]